MTDIVPLTAKAKWERDLNHTFDPDDWESLFQRASSFSYNSRHRLLQFNILHRIYFTPERLHKMNDTLSDACPRCTTETGTLIHMLWNCSKLAPYWECVCEALDEIMGFEVPRSPRIALLGDTTEIPMDKRARVRFIKLAMIAGTKCILMLWKSSDPPSFSMWLKEVSSYMVSEKIMFNLKKKPQLFVKCWSGFKEYLELRHTVNQN